MKRNIFLIVTSLLVLSAFSYAAYKPIPAKQPMGEYVIYLGQAFEDTFYIEDPNGPEGLTITCEPEGLIISEPNISIIEGYPEARKYAYDYTFTPEKAGDYEFTITSTDSVGVAVSAKICFEVKGNAPHVFTGLRRFTAVSGTSGRITGEVWTEGKNLVTWPILFGSAFDSTYYQQMRTTQDGHLDSNIYAVEK